MHKLFHGRSLINPSDHSGDMIWVKETGKQGKLADPPASSLSYKEPQKNILDYRLHLCGCRSRFLLISAILILKGPLKLLSCKYLSKYYLVISEKIKDS